MRPTFDATLSASRTQCLARVPRAPPALLALLQIAGTQWMQLLYGDSEALQSWLKPTMGQLPPPRDHSGHWLALAVSYPV